jgi:phosphoribosylformylglycinamidine synthase
LQQIEAFDSNSIPEASDLKQIAEFLISLPNIASKRWIYNQYDSMVGTGNASTNEPSDAAIVVAKPTEKALALTTDCNSRYVFANPYQGAMIAVAEAARNIVCSGGKPLGVTNCLNFGNPYDPEVYFQFVEAVKGMGEACRRFDTPVTGGNVSFYNQSPDGPVYPTPTIGMVGVLEHANDKMTMHFKQAGDAIFLLGHLKNDFNSSEYLHKFHGVEFSPAPYFNLEEEAQLHDLVLNLIGEKAISSAHDVSEGGLMVTLMESGFFKGLGFDVQQQADSFRSDAFWFGEAQGRVVVSVAENQMQSFNALVAKHGIPCTDLGRVTQAEVSINGQSWGDVRIWQSHYENAIGEMLKKG